MSVELPDIVDARKGKTAKSRVTGAFEGGEGVGGGGPRLATRQH